MMGENKMTQWIKQTPRKMLLLDGWGALLSGTLYILVLAQFETLFGMPPWILYALGGLAFMYAAFSFLNYFFNTKSWKTALKVIAFLNTLHCILTLCLMVYFSDTLTMLAYVYFFTEISIVLFLAYVEFKNAVG